MNIVPDNPMPGNERLSGHGDQPWSDRLLGRDEAESEFSLAELLRIAWDNKLLLLASMGICAGLAGWSVITAIPLYTTETTVVLETERRTVVDFEDVIPQVGTDYVGVNTELQELRSDPLIARVVDVLRLDQDPEFNPTLREPRVSPLGWLLGTVRSQLGVVPPASPSPTPERIREIAIDQVRKRSSVSLVDDAYIFRISAETESASKSAMIANAIAQQYIEYKREVQFRAMSEAMTWLSNRVIDLKTDLETAEASIEDFAARAGVVSETALGNNAARLNTLRDRQREKQTEARETRARIERMSVLRHTGDFDTIGKETQVGSLRLLAQELARNPDDGEALTRFDTLLTRQFTAGTAAASRAEEQAASLAEAVAELEGDINLQSQELVRLRQLQREAEATRLVYEHSLGRLKELSVQEGVQPAGARVLSPARVPQIRSYPKVTRSVAQGAALGLVLGVVLVFLRTSLRNTILTPEELEKLTGLPVLGIIPQAPRSKPHKILELITEQPTSGLPEAVRNLRTSILLSTIDTPVQVIMLTSSAPNEGKTVLSTALAQSLAMSDKRVLLIDCDLRRRMVRDYMRIEERPGVISLLSGEAKVEDIVYCDDKTGLHILLADKSPISASDFFGSKRFEAFLEGLKSIYDYVVIDTPPVLAVPDARIVAQTADAVVFAVQWNSTRERMILSALRLLQQVNVRVTGLAMTRVDPHGMDRYGYYGYGYGQGYGQKRIDKYYTAN
ncbi:MAG: polysaccharide biosynthesis tyrosine autokinase [Pseudomonadota bacterium]